MNDPLEHDVYIPVNILHLSYLVSFASYFCGSIGFNEVILIEMPGALIFISLFYQTELISSQNTMY